MLFNKISNKSIREDNILRSEMITNKNTSKLWKINLFWGETRILRSEKKPIKNIDIIKNLKMLLKKKKLREQE